MAQANSEVAGSTRRRSRRKPPLTAMRPDYDKHGNPIPDYQATDSLHMVPLRVVPLETAALRRARLVKNAQLVTMVELFGDQATGSGQIGIDDLEDYFPHAGDSLQNDLPILHRLARTNSFDVYTLRIELRRMNIPVNDYASLSLSEEKRRELTIYMREFTGPLIRHVYGTDNKEIKDVTDIIDLVTNPNKQEALENLRRLAEALQIDIMEIPTFLEEYGDIYLSLAYFRSCLEEIIPQIHKFIPWVQEVQESYTYQQDAQFKQTSEWIRDTMGDIATSITGRFEMFNSRSKHFWDNINADTFHEVRRLIQEHHTTIGGVLCGLALKMRQWNQRFPYGGGGPHRRVEFIKAEILPGLEKLKRIEDSAASSPRI